MGASGEEEQTVSFSPVTARRCTNSSVQDHWHLVLTSAFASRIRFTIRNSHKTAILVQSSYLRERLSSTRWWMPSTICSASCRISTRRISTTICFLLNFVWKLGMTTMLVISCMKDKSQRSRMPFPSSAWLLLSTSRSLTLPSPAPDSINGGWSICT